jgi:hypothetical protein
VIAESAYLFSVAALSVSLAGFAGLVAAFRRGAEWTGTDVFRLREIAEFGLGNAVLALLVVPLATTTADVAFALRIAGAAGVAFVIVGVLVLIRRQASLNIPADRVWYAVAATIDFAAIALGIATVLGGSIGLFEWLLLSLLARPMLAFALALASLRS